MSRTSPAMEAEHIREELWSAVERAELVDAHAHNLVHPHSSFPFLRCFSEADGDALSLAPHTLSFKVPSFNLILLIRFFGGRLVAW